MFASSALFPNATNTTNTMPTGTTNTTNTTNPIPPTNSELTTSSINNGGLATAEECELDFQARTIVKGFTNPISSEDIQAHFQLPTTAKKLTLLQAHILRLCFALDDVEKLKGAKARDTKNRILVSKKNYNKALNPVLSIVLDSSPLRNLLFVNEQLKCVSKRTPRVKEHVDFVDAFGGIVGNAPFLLHTKGPQAIGGGRTEFDTPEACLSAMRACIELCVDWRTHIEEVGSTTQPSHSRKSTRVELYGRTRLVKSDTSLYALKIPFVGSEYWVRSDDPRLRHILCAGNPPRVDTKTLQKGLMNWTHSTFRTLYPHYAEFLTLVEAQIKQIVRNSHSNDWCPITIIPCCRIEPVCSGETYTMKVQRGGSKLVTCGLCRMDLCAGGCGRVYHGNTPCTVSLDEASAAFIQESSKPCPQCGVHIHKTDGCNHMTCRCRCEFCWLCGVEMPRDGHGRYRTDMHFGVEGQGVNGRGCRQFS